MVPMSAESVKCKFGLVQILRLQRMAAKRTASAESCASAERQLRAVVDQARRFTLGRRCTASKVGTEPILTDAALPMNDVIWLAHDAGYT